MRRALFIQMVVLWILASAAPAGAHASLLSSEPPAETKLDHSPTSVTLTLTEEPDLTLSTFRIVDDKGRSVRAEKTEVIPTGVRGPFRVRIKFGPLEEGAYQVSWRVLSRIDGHVTGGSFIFGLRVDPENFVFDDLEVIAQTGLPLTGAVGRFVLLAGLAALLGSAWVSSALFAVPPVAIRRFMAAALGTGFIGLALLANTQRRAAQVSIADLVPTFVGQTLMGRAGALVMAGVAIVVASRWVSVRRWAILAAGFAAAGAMLVHVAAGHAAGSSATEWTRVASQWIHFAAVGVWLGGLAALLIGIRGAPAEDKARAVRGFSKVAGLALLAVVISGAARAIAMIGAWENLVSTAYGRVVIIKVALFLGLLGLGAVNRYRHVPIADQKLRGLRLVSGGELALAVVILGATALLTNLSPPTNARASPQRESPVVAFGSDVATTMKVRLEIQRGRTGANVFELTATDFDTGTPIDATRVSLRFKFLGGGDSAVLEMPLELEKLDRGRFGTRSRDLAIDGRIRVVVLIQTSEDAAEVTLEIVNRCRAEVHAAEGGPQLHAIPLSEGSSARAYLDPGEPGANDVHVTFESGGGQMTVRYVALFASRGGGTMRLEERRLSAGQFVAETRLAAGKWRFDVEAATEGGQPLRGCFEQMVGGRDVLHSVTGDRRLARKGQKVGPLRLWRLLPFG